MCVCVCLFVCLLFLFICLFVCFFGGGGGGFAVCLVFPLHICMFVCASVEPTPLLCIVVFLDLNVT